MPNMTDSVLEVSTPPSVANLVALANAFTSFAAHVQRVVAHVADLVEETRKASEAAWQIAEHNCRRAALLEAYKVRRKWKKGDGRRLEALGISDAARRHLERAGQARVLGQPVVLNYRPLREEMAVAARLLDDLFNPSTPPHVRRCALKKTPWWPYFVEAVYRGEHDAAKAERRTAPSTVAEDITGQVFGIAPDTVRRTAGRVRNMRVLGTGLPDSPSARASDFETWKRSGRLPGDARGPGVRT